MSLKLTSKYQVYINIKFHNFLYYTYFIQVLNIFHTLIVNVDINILIENNLFLFQIFYFKILNYNLI